MKLDMARYTGYFNFHFSGRFAVDEELFSFLISCYDLPTPKIFSILRQMAVDRYLNDNLLYLFAVTTKKIKATPRNVSAQDRHQRTLDGTLQEVPTLTALERNMMRLKNELRSKNLLLESARAKVNESISLESLMKVKHGRNQLSTLLKGVGTKKLEKMIHAGIKTARQLVDYPGVPECWAKSNDTMKQFNKMRKVAANLFLDRQRIVDSLENEVADLQEQYNVVKSQVNLERSVREQMHDNGEILPDQPTLPPLFSKMFDAKGYNAKILSMGRIENLLMTDFLNRKQVQLSKMTGLASEILKLDFSYKLAQKIHVYSGIGKFFQPYKCLATV
jgi:hypothetical protein